MPAQDRTPAAVAEGSAFRKPVFPELRLDIVADQTATVADPAVSAGGSVARPHHKHDDDKLGTPERRNARGAGKARRDQGAHQTRRYAFRRS